MAETGCNNRWAATFPDEHDMPAGVLGHQLWAGDQTKFDVM